MPDKEEPTPDYRELRDSLGSDMDLYNPSLSLFDNVQEAFRTSIILPNEEIQLPVLSAFACLPTALLNIAPILVAMGISGSGKSQIMKALGKLNGITPLGSSSTFASIRTGLKKISFHDEFEEQPIPNYCLVFDDAKRGFVEDENRFAILRYGYDRGTARVTICGAQPGSIITFNTFGPKAFSTTESFLFEAEYSELKRRCIVIRTKKDPDNPRIEELVPPEECNYSTLRNALRSHWSRIGNCQDFLDAFKGTRRSPTMFNTDDWTIFRPVIATLSHLGGVDVDEAKVTVKAFLNLSEDDTTPLQLILENYLSDYEELVDEKIAQGKEDVSVSLEGKVIKELICSSFKQGLIQGQRLQDYKPEMESRGWRLTKNREGKVSWVYGV